MKYKVDDLGQVLVGVGLLEKDELDLYNDYLDYLRRQHNIDDFEWSFKTKWRVIVSDDEYYDVISFKNYLLMLNRDKKLKELLTYDKKNS